MYFFIRKNVDYRLILIYLFVFLGPLGNILTPSTSFPPAFRAYYVLLPLFPFLYKNFNFKEFKNVVIFIFITAYLVFSLLIVLHEDVKNYSEAVSRFFLLVTQLFFVYGAIIYIKQFALLDASTKILKIFLFSYFISLALGYYIFVGSYLGFVDAAFIDKFTILNQYGYGIWRMSPGSYPNEYGIVTSFVLSILILCFFGKHNSDFRIFKKPVLMILIIPAFCALMMATTRAAYVAFVVCIIYISIVNRVYVRLLLLTTFFCFVGYTVLTLYDIDIIQILKGGFDSLSLTKGSTGERFTIWNMYLLEFSKDPLLGLGFSETSNGSGRGNLHNLYLQLLFELGVFFILILFFSFMFVMINNLSNIKRMLNRVKERPGEKVFYHIVIIGLIHVLWFAASNHNLNHFLTWFVFFLIGMLISAQREAEKKLPSHISVRIKSVSIIN